MVWIEAEVPRVSCRVCGVCVAHTPWARAGAGHTVDFDRQTAWSATRMSKSAVVEAIRIAWRTVGAIVTRYWQDVDDCFDRYQHLRRIGMRPMLRRWWGRTRVTTVPEAPARAVRPARCR